ncbi:hypothetical protein ACOI1H_23660, partial [Loktanella sp. DJP18]|uniref:hypothetical protein n=1 Tax=Loktanella sp. DJP18 TaxID=3409788 RepID=UPI003BB7E4F4
MSDQEWTYWKRRDGETGCYISGFGKAADVPSYGEVSTAALPEKLSITTREDGTLTIISPPVICARSAYRYAVTITSARRTKIVTGDQYELDLDLRMGTQVAEAPKKGTSRENWWWYAQDKFRYESGTQAPIRLMKAWKHDILAIILEDHPEKEQRLAAWQGRISAHNDSVRRNGKKKTIAHRKVHGDLVVLPHAITFDGGCVKQIFRYNVDDASYLKRAKHSLMIAGAPYAVRHGDAVTFKNGTPPGERFSVPIRVAMCLLSWSQTPSSSAHEILGAVGKFETLLTSLLNELEDAMTVPSDNDNTHSVSAKMHSVAANIDAAISALTDFTARTPKPDTPPREADALIRIKAHFDRTLEQLVLGRSRVKLPGF